MTVVTFRHWAFISVHVHLVMNRTISLIMRVRKMATLNYRKLNYLNRIGGLKRSGVLMALILVFSGASIGSVLAAEEATAPAPLATKGVLQLLEYDYPSQGSGQREWIVHCTIPVPQLSGDASVAVKMDDNGYRCKNDEASAFRLLGTDKVIVGFFDDKCTDGNMYDDDNYEYKVTRADVDFPIIYSFVPSVSAGTEVTSGLVYHRGSSKDGIDGKLTCVKFWSFR